MWAKIVIKHDNWGRGKRMDGGDLFPLLPTLKKNLIEWKWFNVTNKNQCMQDCDLVRWFIEPAQDIFKILIIKMVLA